MKMGTLLSLTVYPKLNCYMKVINIYTIITNHVYQQPKIT